MKILDRIVGFQRIKAKDLRPNPHNWRKHPPEQADALRGLLAEVGYVGALMARRMPDGSLQLIDGHLRAETTPDTKVPVLIVDLTQEEADKVLATYDPLSAMAEGDLAKLDLLAGDFTLSSPPLQDMLDSLRASLGPDELSMNDLVEDECPLPPDEATTKPGNLWQLGNHRLLCGDSSLPADVDRLLGGLPIHLVNSDPPYNVKVEPRSNNAIAAGLSSFAGNKHHQSLDLARDPGKAKSTQKQLRPKDRPLANDFVTDQEFDRLLLAWFGNMADRKSVV